MPRKRKFLSLGRQKISPDKEVPVTRRPLAAMVCLIEVDSIGQWVYLFSE